MIGRRPHMEDAVCLRGCYRNRPTEDLFAVFDGHGTEGNGKKSSRIFVHVFLRPECSCGSIEALHVNKVALVTSQWTLGRLHRPYKKTWLPCGRQLQKARTYVPSRAI
eukprot:20060_5